MIKIALSRAASALLRALIDRAAVQRNRILLTEIRSVDWQSLTFNGERHEIFLRVTGPGSAATVDRLCWGLEDAEFDIPGHIVVDVGVLDRAASGADGSTILAIEALTIAAD